MVEEEVRIQRPCMQRWFGPIKPGNFFGKNKEVSEDRL